MSAQTEIRNPTMTVQARTATDKCAKFYRNRKQNEKKNACEIQLRTPPDDLANSHSPYRILSVTVRRLQNSAASRVSLPK